VLNVKPDNGGAAIVGHGYREDIDWLRAIAVLAVVGFHFEAPRVLSGFVGVDIFFVISGFLITQIIQSEVHAGTFSFAQFYERRVRRLLPALYAMVALTAIPSFHYLLTSERLEFFRSIAAAVTFTSNFYFWFQAGYFDHAAVEKPLLHTWSLAVEEQFYLALPILLWALLRFARDRRGHLWVPIALSAAALASFALSVWLIATDRTATAFFMSPPRTWEFLIGAIVAIGGFPVLRNIHLRRVARGVGIVLMLVAIFSPRSQSFPGFAALLPCIGAAMFIWIGNGVTPAKLSRNWIMRIMRFYGRISYSMYLWHWPLFTFARFSKNSTTDPQAVNILQATQAACMPTFNAAEQGNASCRSFAGQMDAFLGNRKPPDLVILSADWLEYARPPRFDGMIADIKQTILKLNGLGIPVVLLGPAVQFRSRLPSMLMRAHVRDVDARPDDFVLPDIFSLDQEMKAALPAQERFSYVSVVDAVCPARQCPLTIDRGIPLASDHAHLTGEGSVYVMNRVAPMLGLKR
jgi:peptidoglycan/LPS O-acetylase OafA/YrhL